MALTTFLVVRAGKIPYLSASLMNAAWNSVKKTSTTTWKLYPRRSCVVTWSYNNMFNNFKLAWKILWWGYTGSGAKVAVNWIRKSKLCSNAATLAGSTPGGRWKNWWRSSFLKVGRKSPPSVNDSSKSCNASVGSTCACIPNSPIHHACHLTMEKLCMHTYKPFGSQNTQFLSIARWLIPTGVLTSQSTKKI